MNEEHIRDTVSLSKIFKVILNTMVTIGNGMPSLISVDGAPKTLTADNDNDTTNEGNIRGTKTQRDVSRNTKMYVYDDHIN